MPGGIRARIAERLEELRDPSRPLPAEVWGAFALLLSAILLLSLRLLVFRAASVPVETAPPRAASAPAAGRFATSRSGPASEPPPPSSPEAFAALVEGWRRAWIAKDLDTYLAYYSASFGAQGKDLDGWREQKARLFAEPGPLDVEVRGLEASVGARIAILEFGQSYRGGGHVDRGLKRLYLAPEAGAWRIFNEEWEPESPARATPPEQGAPTRAPTLRGPAGARPAPPGPPP